MLNNYFGGIFNLMQKIFFLLLLSPVFLYSQPKGYTTQSNKAIKNFESAVKFVSENNSEKAIAQLLDAIKADENFMEAHMLLGDLYADHDSLQQAVDEYKKSVSINPSAFPNSYFALGKYEMQLEKYADAREHFQKFVSLPNIKPEKKSEAERDIASCDFAVEAMKHPVNFSPQNVGENINSQFDEYFPSITVDQKQFLFTRNIPSAEWPGHFQEDFFISLHENGKQNSSHPLGQPVNTQLNEGAPCFSPDGQLIFFTACDRNEGKGSCDIYYSRKKGNSWTKPLNLGAPVNTGAWESQPSFSSDGKTLFFVRGSGARNNYQEQDIYTSEVSLAGWSEPVKLGPGINTDGREEAPYIHPDNQTLYFISNGHPGMGGMDIFMSRKSADGTWGAPLNLGYPINTGKNETGLIVDPKGERAYYSSDRSGGNGGLDIYSFALDDKLKPVPVTYIKGNVKDIATNLPLESKFEIIDLAGGKTIVESYSDKLTGDFIATLASGKEYALNVSKKGYVFYSDHFECKTEAGVKNPFLIDVKLSPVKEGSKVILNNIFFDTNSSELKRESMAELNKLILFLKDNATVKIEIGGHTDNIGDDKSNQILSEKRAKSVSDFLIKSGIDLIRVLSKGYGETKPVADNASEEGRAKNRRTEFTVIALK